jgi:hypothetical protein
MTKIKIIAGGLSFVAKLEEEKSPKTCEWFRNLLPYKEKMVHVRWSGHAGFIPINDIAMEVAYEKPISHPSRGEILLYPGAKGINGGEIYIPYGGSRFACPSGQIAGNHFLTIIEGDEQLPELGRKVHWEGAQEIEFELLDVK